MLFIWTGWGILALFIPPVGIVLGSLASHNILGVGDYTVVKVAVIFLSSYALWVLGRKLNSSPERVLIDAKTGEEVRIKSRYTLFWIPMEWWSIAWAILGVYGLLLDNV